MSINSLIKKIVQILIVITVFDGTGCRHAESGLHDENGPTKPHNMTNPNGDDWGNSDEKTDSTGGQTNKDVDPDPAEDSQETSGTGPIREKRRVQVKISVLTPMSAEGAFHVPENATNLIVNSQGEGEAKRVEIEFDHEGAHIIRMYHDGQWMGTREDGNYDAIWDLSREDGDGSDGGVTGTTKSIDSEESSYYPYSSDGGGVGNGDDTPNETTSEVPSDVPYSNSGEGNDSNSSNKTPDPSRSGERGKYRKQYSNFSEMKRSVEANEKRHRNVIKNATEKYKRAHTKFDAKRSVKDYVDSHNKLVNATVEKSPLLGELDFKDISNQRTPISSPEGRKILVGKNYSRYTRNSIQNGTQSGHEHSEDLLDFADETIDLADKYYSGGNKQQGAKALEIAITAIDVATDFISGVAFAKDVFALATGYTVTGEQLSNVELAVIAGMLFMPAAVSGTAKSIRRVVKVAKTAANHYKKAKKAKKAASSTQNALERLVKKTGNPNFARLVSDLNGLPGGRQVGRIKVGSSDKVAIIGRGMEGVDGVENCARHLRSKNHKVKTFYGHGVSSDAEKEWARLTNGGKRLSNKEVKNTLMFKENVVFAKQLKDEGYTVIDLTENGRGSSLFYEMEKLIIFGD